MVNRCYSNRKNIFIYSIYYLKVPVVGALRIHLISYNDKSNTSITAMLQICHWGIHRRFNCTRSQRQFWFQSPGSYPRGNCDFRVKVLSHHICYLLRVQILWTAFPLYQAAFHEHSMIEQRLWALAFIHLHEHRSWHMGEISVSISIIHILESWTLEGLGG